MFAAIISDVWNSQLIFLKLFPGIYTSKSLMNNSPPPFVQHYIGFLFIEEVVKMLLEYLGKFRSTVPPPWLLRACKTLHGVLLFRYVNRHTTRFSSEWKSYRHDPPGGVWGGGAPPTCRPPSFLVVKKKWSESKTLLKWGWKSGSE